MADEYRAQLLAVEAKLAKDPENEELLSLKSDLIELIELSGSLDEEKEAEEKVYSSNNHKPSQHNAQNSSGQSSYRPKPRDNDQTIDGNANDNLVDQIDGGDVKAGPNQRRQLSEAELLAKKKEKNKKKKAKLREKFKEQLDTAESVKQSWQSFANQKGLKGLTKKSIFASPSSITGKVGVGTNGIADATGSGARMGGASQSSAPASSAPITKRRRY